MVIWQACVALALRELLARLSLGEKKFFEKLDVQLEKIRIILSGVGEGNTAT